MLKPPVWAFQERHFLYLFSPYKPVRFWQDDKIEIRRADIVFPNKMRGLYLNRIALVLWGRSLAYYEQKGVQL